VLVTGYGSKRTDTGDYATVAYNPDTGVQKWVRRFNAGGTDRAEAIAIDPTGTKVYVSGQSEERSAASTSSRSRTTRRREPRWTRGATDRASTSPISPS
jgi:hypothetical protein